MVTPRKTGDAVPVYRDGDDENGISLTNLPPSPELDDEETQLANVLADLGGANDAKVNVHRVMPGKGTEFVAVYTPDSFSLEELQSSYGGGQYSIQVRANGRIVTRRVVHVAAAVKRDIPVTSSGVDTEKIMQTMQQGFQTMGNMFLEGMRGLVQNQAPQKTTADMLNELLLMKQVLGGNETKQVDPMESMLRHFEFFKQLNPSDREPGTTDVLLEGLKNLGPVLMQGMQQQQQANAHIVRPAPPLVPPINNQPVPPAENPLPESDPMSLAQTFYINMLVQNAKTDPEFLKCETYANTMLDMLGDQAAFEVLNMPDWFDKLVAINPEAKEFRPWFEEMRKIALEELTPIDENDITGITDSPSQSNAVQQPTTPPEPA